MIYLQFLRYRAKHIYKYSSSSVEMGNCRSFFALHPPRNHNNQNFKKWKNLLDIILQMCTKNHNHMMYGSWDMEWETEFFVIFSHFLPFYHIPTFHQPPNNHKKQNFEKKMKRIPGNIIPLYIHVYHKWRSYLKYKVQQTEIFVLSGHFLPF